MVIDRILPLASVTVLVSCPLWRWFAYSHLWVCAYRFQYSCPLRVISLWSLLQKMHLKVMISISK